MADSRTGSRRPAIAGRDGVVVLPHADPGPGIHPGLQQPRRIERLSRQRPHGGLLVGERGGDRDRPAGDHPAVIDDVAGGDQLVQRGQRRDGGDGDQVAAAEPADLAFHPALLVRAFLARGAEERVVPGLPSVQDF